jgi:hypothetical protein
MSNISRDGLVLMLANATVEGTSRVIGDVVNVGAVTLSDLVSAGTATASASRVANAFNGTIGGQTGRPK